MIILKDAENALDKTQPPFMIKTPRSLEIEETFLTVSRKTYSQHHPSWDKTEPQPLYPQIASVRREDKEINTKVIYIGNQGVKLSLFTEYVMFKKKS